jgi:RimJ/RimL family protein N-acetyltransferase
MAWLEPVTLTGASVRLELLHARHGADLCEAVADGELWKLWYTHVPPARDMAAEIARRLSLLEQGTMLPFAVIETATDAAVGMTTFMNVDAINRRVEIGGTWYRKRVQRGPINSECKLLLLSHAFNALDCIAVEFRTHYFNHASRRAIERLGAKLDGVLRSHQRVAGGSLRDTCVYSIIASEWPAVETHLRWQLARPRD